MQILHETDSIRTYIMFIDGTKVTDELKRKVLYEFRNLIGDEGSVGRLLCFTHV